MVFKAMKTTQILQLFLPATAKGELGFHPLPSVQGDMGSCVFPAPCSPPFLFSASWHVLVMEEGEQLPS